MSKTQSLRKIIAMLTVLTMVFVLSVSASAATNSTTTAYSLDGSKSVRVTSTLSGLTVGEEVTYLAKAADNSIAYVAQVTAAAASFQITYVADIDDVVNTTVKFAATTSQKTAASVVLDEIGVTLTDANYDVTGDGDVELSDYILDGSYVFTLVPDANKKVSALSYSLDGGTTIVPVLLSKVITGGAQSYFIVDADDLTVNYILYVTFDDAEPVAESSVTQAKGFGTPMLDAGADNNITTYAKVKPASGLSEDDYEYGILFGYAPADLVFTGSNDDWVGNTAGTISLGSGVKKFRALGKGVDGSFAVTLIDGGSGLLDGADAYYTRTYVVEDGDYLNATYGPAIATFIAE